MKFPYTVCFLIEYQIKSSIYTVLYLTFSYKINIADLSIESFISIIFINILKSIIRYVLVNIKSGKMFSNYGKECIKTVYFNLVYCLICRVYHMKCQARCFAAGIKIVRINSTTSDMQMIYSNTNSLVVKPRQHIKKQRHYFADKGP